MSKNIDKHFVSNIDKFLEELRQQVPESASQTQERKKFERINHLRDNAVKKDKDDSIWSDF